MYVWFPCVVSFCVGSVCMYRTCMCISVSVCVLVFLFRRVGAFTMRNHRESSCMVLSRYTHSLNSYSYCLISPWYLREALLHGGGISYSLFLNYWVSFLPDSVVFSLSLWVLENTLFYSIVFSARRVLITLASKSVVAFNPSADISIMLCYQSVSRDCHV